MSKIKCFNFLGKYKKLFFPVIVRNFFSVNYKKLWLDWVICSFKQMQTFLEKV